MPYFPKKIFPWRSIAVDRITEEIATILAYSLSLQPSVVFYATLSYFRPARSKDVQQVLDKSALAREEVRLYRLLREEIWEEDLALKQERECF